MGRPTKTVVQPAFLVHLGHIETWTDYGNGFGDDREVPEVKPDLMGKRPCRWIRENDCVCVDLEHVTCELCLKSAAAQKERARRTKNQIKPNRATAEGRLFWKQLNESVNRYRKETTPQQRFEAYFYSERRRRIVLVAKVEDPGTNHVKVITT